MPEWLNDAVFYEIYPQSFNDTNGDGIGDIPGITQKLGYIQDLGCNAIWLNPCYDSPFWDAGYDVRDYKKVAPRYGTNEDLFDLFEQVHKRGMRIILDLVPGHTSIDHPWFIEASKHEPNEYSNRFIFSPSVWERPEGYKWVSGYTERDGNFMVNFFSTQPALNYGFHKVTDERWQKPPEHPDCQATVEAMIDVMRFWLDKGADGFRVDMADSLVKDDDERISTCKIWRKIRDILDKEYPEAAMVSEWGKPQLALSRAGYHMDFYLDWFDSGINALFRSLDENGQNNSYISKCGRGDITRFLDDYLPKYEESKKDGYFCFITCNHDVPRLTRNLSVDEIKLAYAIVFTMPGVPYLYYGDEIGMRYNADLPSKEAGYQRTGSRTPMQWGSGKNLGFSEAPIEKLYLPVDAADDAPTVEAQKNDPDSMLNTVKGLIALRHSQEDLKAVNNFEVVHANKGDPLFIYRRGKVLMFVNPGLKEVSYKLDGLKYGEVLYKIGGVGVYGDTVTLASQSFGVLG